VNNVVTMDGVAEMASAENSLDFGEVSDFDDYVESTADFDTTNTFFVGEEKAVSSVIHTDEPESVQLARHMDLSVSVGYVDMLSGGTAVFVHGEGDYDNHPDSDGELVGDVDYLDNGR